MREGGGALAQAARPLFYRGQPSWVVVFSEPLDDVERQRSALIQRQILIAGLIALVARDRRPATTPRACSRAA